MQNMRNGGSVMSTFFENVQRNLITWMEAICSASYDKWSCYCHEYSLEHPGFVLNLKVLLYTFVNGLE